MKARFGFNGFSVRCYSGPKVLCSRWVSCLESTKGMMSEVKEDEPFTAEFTERVFTGTVVKGDGVLTAVDKTGDGAQRR